MVRSLTEFFISHRIETLVKSSTALAWDCVILQTFLLYMTNLPHWASGFPKFMYKFVLH